MAYDPIALGTLPNDNTGTPLRSGGTKINEMFLELYTLMGGKADASSVNAALAILTVTDADTAAALALKANAEDLAAKANADDVPNMAIPLPLTIAQAQQLIANTGGHVTLKFELMPDTD